MESLNYKNLLKTYKRLRKNTKNFSDLIVRDPVDFIDFEIELEKNLKNLIFLINSGAYSPKPPYFLLSAKTKGINRPTVVLEISDAIVYRFCIEQIEDELFKKSRQPNIRGGVKITANILSEGDDYYEKWFKDWMEHQENLRQGLKKKPYLVSTDIASYFENINILVLKDYVRTEILGKKELLNLLFYFLEQTKYRHDYEVNTFIQCLALQTGSL